MKTTKRIHVGHLVPSDSISIGGLMYTIISAIPAPQDSTDGCVYLHLRSSGIYASETSLRLRSNRTIEYYPAD